VVFPSSIGNLHCGGCFADAAHIREPSYPEGYRYCCESMGEPGTPCEADSLIRNKYKDGSGLLLQTGSAS
jgi:hypothetical protein